MPNNKLKHTYPIENLEIEVNGRELTINGYAKYTIDKQNSGESGAIFARFVKLKITNWDCKCRTVKDAMTGLTKSDIKAVEDSILDNLNENYELCDYLASEDAEGF